MYVLLKLDHHNEQVSTKRGFELTSAPPYISESLNKLGELAFYGLQKTV